MNTLYPNDQTRQIVADAVNRSATILWILDRTKSLFFNPAITSGPTAGVFPTPSQTPSDLTFWDYVVQGGNCGFAPAASAAGVFTWDGTLTEIADDSATAAVLTGITVLNTTVVG